MDANNKRNFVLLGHAQSGKTSLGEALLYACRATNRKGKIGDGTTVSDYGFDEIEKKNSINMSLLYCDYKGLRLQIVDTPGYLDFLGEALAGARAVDSAVIVIDASGGIEVGAERAWQISEELGLPVIIFINKTDKEGTDVNKVLSDIKNQLSKKAVMSGSLDEPDVIEAIAESDDKLLEKYLEGTALSSEELTAGFAQAVIKRKIFPVLSGSATTDKGIPELLEAIVKDLPSPAARPAIEASDPLKPGEKKELALSADASFAAFVFKNIFDPYVGQLTLLRVFSGTLNSNTAFYNVNKKNKERIGQIYLLQGKEQRNIDSASCGDIVAIAKLKDVAVSDSLSTGEKEQFLFERITFPEPAISASVKPKSREDEEKISGALSKLADEDQTFRISRDAQTKELIVSGSGDLHLAVMIGRLKRRFNVEVELGTPKVSYKETITKPIKIQGKYKRQSGGRGQYGDVWIEIQPLERGGGFEFVDKIFGGAIPKNFIPSVEKGVLHACAEGAVAGYPIADLRVILYDGSYHDVDSSDMAFQIAGGMALRRAVMEAGPVLLEPIMEVEVSIPEEYLGAISGDINSRRGRIMGMEVKGRTQVVKAHVPLSEMFKYANDLRSITGGRGSYTMRFSHYEQVPHKVASGIIAQYQSTRKQEE